MTIYILRLIKKDEILFMYMYDNLPITHETDTIYQMILNEDESVMGGAWENLYVSEYDTPASIINMMIDTFINDIDVYNNEDYYEVYDEEEDSHYDELGTIGTDLDKRQALAMYFEHLAHKLYKQNMELGYGEI